MYVYIHLVFTILFRQEIKIENSVTMLAIQFSNKLKGVFLSSNRFINLKSYFSFCILFVCRIAFIGTVCIRSIIWSSIRYTEMRVLISYTLVMLKFICSTQVGCTFLAENILFSIKMTSR
jgi:hypothetical protein